MKAAASKISSASSIGFLGPGAMGAGMVIRLLSAGYSVKVWARNPAKLGPLLDAGADLAAAPDVLVRESDVILGCLLDSAVIREVYLGTGGAVSAAHKGQLFVEHATFEPSLAVQIGQALAAHGAGFLDAPVSGGPAGAREGTLVAMVGGEAETLTRLRPVLESYCGRIKHAGTSGSGQRLKLINQLLVSTHAVAAAEAAALVLNSGIDPQVAHEALMGGWASSTMLDLNLPKACAGDFDGEGALIAGLIEVQRLVANFTTEAGVDSALLGPVCEVFNAAVADGRGSQALAAMVTHYTGQSSG